MRYRGTAGRRTGGINSLKGLKQYDGLCVSITDPGGQVYEGVCSYCAPEYCEHEFGRFDEALDLNGFLFYPDDIAAIESLECFSSSYGKFRTPYGIIELTYAEEGTGSIRDVLSGDTPEHIERMLRCINDLLNGKLEFQCEDREGLKEALGDLIKYGTEEKFKIKAASLLKKI